jgi:hypothetical protein
MVLPMTVRAEQFSLLFLCRLDDVRWTPLVPVAFCQPIGVMHCECRTGLSTVLAAITTPLAHR